MGNISNSNHHSSDNRPIMKRNLYYKKYARNGKIKRERKKGMGRQETESKMTVDLNQTTFELYEMEL